MATKTKTSTRPGGGTLAVDRIEYRKTGRKTAAGSIISAVVVDGVELGEVAKAKGSGWLYTGTARPGGYYLPDTKDDAARRLVEAALDQELIRDMDDAAADVALAASALVEVPAQELADGRDDQAARVAAGYLALIPGIRLGDFVTFDNGRTLRVAMVSEERAANRYLPARASSVMLSAGGSWWLSATGNPGGYSGGNDGSVNVADLVDTGETRLGRVSMWHHGTPGGGNAVDVLAPFRVFAAGPDVEPRRR